MKRIVVLVLISVFCFAGLAFAQEKDINKGTILVGGSSTLGLLLGNHEIKPKDSDTVKADTTLFNLTAYGGYFLMHGIEVGPIVGFDYASVNVKQTSLKASGTMSLFDIGAQGAYLYDMGKKTAWAPFGMLALEYMSGKVDGKETADPAPEQKTKTDFSGWSITPRAGVMIFFHPRFALDLSIFYKYISANGKSKDGVTQKMEITSGNYGIMIGFDGFIM